MSEPDSQRILVVDDHREIREALQEYLERHEFAVVTATDAAAGRAMLAETPVDLVVLDIMMPGEDGLSLCREIQATRHLPVIFLTAASEDVDRIAGLELGADDYLIKPFNPRELLARIRAVLRRWHSLPSPGARPAQARLFFEGWTLDTARRELTGGDGAVDLSTGEYDLLLALATHPGQVLSRGQLLVLTRGRDARPFDRSIDIQISRLRRKIESDPANPRLIRTHWGGGYSLATKVEGA